MSCALYVPLDGEKLFSASSSTQKQMDKQYSLKALTFSCKVFFIPYICNVICEDAAELNFQFVPTAVTFTNLTLPLSKQKK